MILIISPAKKMRRDLDFLEPRGLPVFLEKTEQLLAYLRGLPFPELKRLLACNEEIAQRSFREFQEMGLQNGLTPALLAYEGIQYQYMAPRVFEAAYFDYVQEHLRILSGFYGILRPFDGVAPYRLEMQAKVKTSFCKSLYDFWGGSLAEQLAAQCGGTVVNLASQEYARAVRPHLPENVRFLTCLFGEEQEGRVVEKGVYVKMARGEMVRFLAERQAETPEEIQAFRRLEFSFREDLSTETHWVFTRKNHKKKKG